MMKPRVDRLAADGVWSDIRSSADLGEDTLVKQVPSAIVQGLSELCPTVLWERRDDGGWFGAFDGDDGRYEFVVGPEPDYAWSVLTSRRSPTRHLIQPICRTLGLIAFDGQAMWLIGPEGERPA